jgi:hypothetical protein
MVFLLCALGAAQSVKLEALEPPGAQRGTSVAIELRGKALAGAEALVFDHPGLSASEVESEKAGLVRARLVVAPDAPLGPYTVRVRTRRGLSNALMFHVGALVTVDEIEPNGERASAQTLALGVTVHGTITREDEDLFAFKAPPGTRVRAVVEALRLGCRNFDPLVEVLDAEGTTLARNDDSALVRRDSIVEATMPAGGLCLVRVRDAARGGARDARYRLHVDAGAQPRVAGALAVASLVSGAALAPRMLLGESDLLGSATPRVQELTGTAGWAPLGAALWWPEASLAPLVLRVSPLSTSREVEPNDSRKDATALPPIGQDGVAAEGALGSPGDEDSFQVELAAGQTVDVSVWARRLRSPLDATLVVRGPDGRPTSADDVEGLDPVARFTAKKAGVVTITVGDYLDRSGLAFVYRLEVTPVAPRIGVSLAGQARELSVARGRRAYVRLALERTDLKGALALELRGLPEGVVAGGLAAPIMGAQVIALFEARADAPLGSANVEVLATVPGGSAGARGSLRNELVVVPGNNNTVLQAHVQDRLPIAITESTPFDVTIRVPKAPLVRSGKLDVVVSLERDEGFGAPVVVGLAGLPGGVRAPSSQRLEGDTLSATFTLEASGDARLGEAQLLAWAEAPLDGVGVRIASDFAALTVRQPILALTARGVVVEREAEGELTVTFTRTEGAPDGALEIALVGLPHDVKSEARTLPEGGTELVFPLRVGPKAPIGSHRGLGLEARITVAGGVVVQSLSGLELRVQRKAAVAVAIKVPAKADASALDRLRAEHAARVSSERAPAVVAPEAAPEPILESTPESTVEPTAEPKAEPAADPAAKPVADPAAKPAPKLAPKKAPEKAPGAPAPMGGPKVVPPAGASDAPAKKASAPPGPKFKMTHAAVAPQARLRGPRARLAAHVVGDGSEPPAPSFLNDVVPVLTARGCNAGACHGASQGQDGFRLSLFGYDADGDHARLLSERFGRRLDLSFPAESLLLTKATASVPHTGGAVLTAGDEDYNALLNWVRAGALNDSATAPKVVSLTLAPDQFVLAPGESAGLRVEAGYSDGTTRDVTRLALLRTNDASVATLDREGQIASGTTGEAFLTAAFATETVGAAVIVRSEPVGAPWSDPADGLAPQTWIDEFVAEKLRAVGAEPAPLCSDEEFLRRASLDLIGLPPTLEERAAFLVDVRPSSEKRALLVDTLVERPEFWDQWTMRIAELLRVRSTNDISPKAAQAWFEWLQAQLRSGVGVDAIVRRQLTARGGNFGTPQASYFLVERDVKVMAENVAQSMLGVRISCAQCHNHPFDRWTQDDYAGFVAFFAEVRSKRSEDPGERTISDRRGSEFRHPITNQPVPPKYLGGEAPDIGRRARRDVVAEWLTAPGNPWFARNLANRAWAAYMGSGIVAPVDDVRVTNPPSSAALLDALAERLVSGGFDLRDLAREITKSRAYQRTSATPDGDAGFDLDNFAAFQVRRLRAETLSDALSAVAEAPEDHPRLPSGVRATQLADGADAGYFLRTFGRAPRESVCACEVSDAPSLSQALHLVNGATVHEKVTRGPVVTALLEAGLDDAAAVDALYARTLCRAPLPAEREALVAFLGSAVDARRAALEDVFWALLTSNEFLFQR